MSETGSHLCQTASPAPEPGTTASQMLGATPSGQAFRGDDRTVISHRAPAAVVGAGVLAPDAGASLLGERLDHFELQGFVGGGGMGVVFKALDTRLNRIVALKVLAREQADEEEKVRRFQNEAQSAARLDHDHIARVYFVGQDRGLHYIVFEYIEGVNLRDLVARKGPLPLDETISYTLQVAEALAHAASRDVVHRDIKPSNVLITPQGRAKLVDMGLARLHQVEPSENDLTSSGVTLGTFDYISPEQARDPRGADVRSDIYSLGCTAYFMLTARPPFPDGNVLQKLLQHNNDPPPDPAEYNPDLPEQVSRLLRKMLAKDPRRRHQTAGELVSELLVLTEQLGLPTSNVDPLAWAVATPPRITSIERHLPWLAPLAILLVAVVAMELLWPSAPAPIAAPSRSGAAAQPFGPELPQTGDKESNPSDAVRANSVAATNASAQEQQPEKTPESTASINGADRRSPVEPRLPATSANTADESNDRPAIATVAGEPADGASFSVADSSLAGDLGGTRTEGSLPSPAGNFVATETVVRPPVEQAVAKPGVRIVDPLRESDPNVYTTLRQACNDAVDNDVIELHFSGKLEERPIRIIRKTLTIRAGEGHTPTVAFRHRESPASESPAMLTVVGGQLTLMNVALEVEIPTRFNPPSWALFQTQRANSVHLDRCWLTIRNATSGHLAQHPFVAFFEIKAPPDAGAMAMEQPAMGEYTVNIQMTDCVVRGEATLLRCDELQPVRLTWRNGLLATTERLLVAQGSEMANRASGQISIDLRHVTANVRSGLCLIANPEGNRPLLRTEIQCTDSILLASADSPLMEQTGFNSVDDFEGLVEWVGNRYFYAGFTTFWKISSFASAQPSQDPIRRSFDEWQRHWNEAAEQQDVWSSVIWKRLPELDRPLHTHVPADYALDETSSENQARVLGATDGGPAGLQAAELPPLPQGNAAQVPSAGATPPLPEEEQD